MKSYIHISLLCIATLFSNAVYAKGKQQFIRNSGQITDQYRQPRPDVAAKIESNGVALFVGGGALHYQWMRS